MSIKELFATMLFRIINEPLTKIPSSGYYHFDDVQVGETYILSAHGKHYTFSQPSQVLNVNDGTEEVNFIANTEKRFRAF